MAELRFRSLPGLRQYMYENIIPIEGLVDYKNEPFDKILYVYRKYELTPFLEKGKHAYFSALQVLWLNILEMLRELGYSYKMMKKVCDYFFLDAYNNDLFKKNLLENKQYIESQKFKAPLSEEQIDMLESINEILSDKILLKTLKYDINYLSMLVETCFDSGEDAELFIYSDGTVIERAEGKFFSHQESDLNLRRPYIHISITDCLLSFIENEELSKILLPLFLSDEERAVLKQLRNNKISIITINRNGKKTVIKATEKGVIPAAKVAEIKRALGIKNYQDMSVESRDNKTLTFQKTKKIVF